MLVFKPYAKIGKFMGHDILIQSTDTTQDITLFEHAVKTFKAWYEKGGFLDDATKDCSRT